MKDDEVKRGPIPADALRYFKQKGYKFGWSWADVYGSAHETSFTAAKVMRKDVLRAIREELDKAIAEGVPFDEWRKGIKPRLQDLGWWDTQLSTPDPLTKRRVIIDPPRRLRTIYYTNVKQARGAAQMERIQRTKKSRPYLLYVHGPSKTPRPEHLSWHGVLLPVDDPWWQTHTPQNGWMCSCSVRSVSEREATRLEQDGVLSGSATPIVDPDTGLPTGHQKNERVPVRRKAPEVTLVPWKNKRTGETKYIPEGIDPGFEFPPRKARDEALSNSDK